MATYTQQLILELLVKSDQLNKGLKQVGSSTKEAEKQLTSFRDAAGKALSFAASAGIGVGIVKTIKDTTNAYGEFINQQATAQQVFGESFGQLEKAMENSVQAFGQSQTEFLRSTTLIAGLGKAAGIAVEDLVPFATSINKIGADLAAAFNTSTVDAINAIQSGFSGSSIEPLRAYNIVLSDTILKQEYYAITGEKVTGVLTQQQRMAAFLSKLYQESADYQGQWDRESNQFLGTMQRLQATMGDAAVTIGRSFEPAVTAAANALIPLISGAADLNSTMGGLPLTLGMSAAALVALRGPLAAASTGIYSLTAATSALSVKAAAGGLFKSIGASIAALGPAGLVAGSGLAAFAFYSAGATKKANELSGAMKAVAEEAQKVDLSNFQKVLKDITNEDTSFLEDVMSAGFFVVDDAADGAARSLDEMVEKLSDLGVESPRVVASLIGIYKSGGEMADQMRDAGITIEMLEASLRNAAVESEGFKVIQEQIDTILADATGTVERNVDAYDDFAEALSDIADAADDAKESVEELVDDAISKFTDANDVEIARLETLEAINDWVALYNSQIGEGETAQQRNLALLESEKSIRESMVGEIDAAIAGLEYASGQELVGQDRIDAVNEILDRMANDPAYGLMAAQIEELRTDLTSEPVELAVEASTEGATDSIEALFAAADGRQVLLDMLVDSGIAEEEVNAFIDSVGEERAIEIATNAVVDLAEEDIDALSDEERVAEVVAEALVDDATRQLEALSEQGLWDIYSDVYANTDEFVEQMNTAREAAARPIYVPVYYSSSLPPPGTSGGSAVPGIAPTIGEVTTQQLAEGATPTAEGATYSVPAVAASSGIRAVRAGQPISVTNNVYVTVPTADPSATVRSIQRWSRHNGALPIMRGH